MPRFEQLEDRTVLTVVFPLTLYGAETDAPGKTSVGLQNPTVNLVFAGNWNLTEEIPLLNAAVSIVNGPYLTGLMQYSSSGTAVYGTFWNDLNDSTARRCQPGQLGTNCSLSCTSSISQHGPDPGSNDQEHAPIEVVVLDPVSSTTTDPKTGKLSVDNGGFNIPGTYSSPSGGSENVNEIFIGTQAGAEPGGGGVSQDRFTEVLSHELAERMVNDVQQFVLPFPAYKAADGGPKTVQVADGEQENNYNYRLNGDLVQAYWSDQDHAAIVPDFADEFATHKYVVTPKWNTDDPSSPKLLGYDLSISGDEIFDPTVDTVTIGENINGTVSVRMSSGGSSTSEMVAFDESSILNISDQAGGHLVVDDSADTRARTITLGSVGPSFTGDSEILPYGYIKGETAAEIDYANSVIGGPSIIDVRVIGGAGANDFVAAQQQFLVPTIVQGGSGKSTLTGPDATNSWTVSGANSGTLNTGLTFMGIQDLVGGAAGDLFVMKPGGSVLNIDGGGTSSGTVNSLEYISLLNAPIAVNLAQGSATDVNGGARNSVENIQSYITLTSPHMMFVGGVYNDVLGRIPDPGGLSYWANLLDQGTAISSVAQLIAHSDEYYANIVIRPTYLMLLGRAADDAGVTFWTSQMHGGLTDQALSAGFAAADEFYNAAGGTDTDWVDAVYKLLLGRTVDSSGEMYWNGQLAAGQTRLQVAERIANSQENDTQLINADYMHYLGRAADAGGITYWLAQFANGQTNEDVIAGFTGSAEYYDEHTSFPNNPTVG